MSECMSERVYECVNEWMSHWVSELVSESVEQRGFGRRAVIMMWNPHDIYIRSTIWHGFIHYKDVNEWWANLPEIRHTSSDLMPLFHKISVSILIAALLKHKDMISIHYFLAKLYQCQPQFANPACELMHLATKKLSYILKSLHHL